MSNSGMGMKDPFLSYLRLMDTLTAQFGSNCQVSLYDMRSGAARLAAVSGTIMDLQIGSRLSPAVLDRLAQAGNSNSGRATFTASTPDGRRLSSSLTLLTDPSSGESIGCLRIDFCIEHLMSSIDVLQTFCAYPEDKAADERAKAGTVEDVADLVDSIISDALRNRTSARSMNGKEYRMQIVRNLDERGVFLVKGAIEIVSAKMNVSKYTIYNYLDKIKKSGLLASKKSSASR